MCTACTLPDSQRNRSNAEQLSTIVLYPDLRQPSHGTKQLGTIVPHCRERFHQSQLLLAERQAPQTVIAAVVTDRLERACQHESINL